MKAIICGSRELCGFPRDKDPELWDEHAEIFVRTLSEYPDAKYITEVVSGKARGVDTLGDLWSQVYLYKDSTPFYANWKKYKKAAGSIRNQEMLDYCLTSDIVIAIIRYDSKGTKDMVERAKKKGLKVYENLVEFKSYDEKHPKCSKPTSSSL